jgi:hypothetical protein
LTVYDQDTGEVIDNALELFDPDVSIQTDTQIIAMSEQALHITIMLIEAGLELGGVNEARSKAQALTLLVSSHMRGREARVEAANNLAEARLRIERHSGQMIQRGQLEGWLYGGTHGGDRNSSTLEALEGYQITKKQSSTWQKVATVPLDIFDDYLAETKESGGVISTAGLLKYWKDCKPSEHDPDSEVEDALDSDTEKNDVEVGEWWQLGRHKLFCGDTSNDAFISHLPQAAFAFADPPYNANAAEWDNDFEWLHNYLIDYALIVAVTPGISAISDFFATSAQMPYAWSMAAWITNGMTRGALGFGNWIYIALFADDSIHRNAQDVLRISIKASDRETNNFKGRKPSALMIALIELFTNERDIIIDPFLGSGTTLLCAEITGRVCVGGEIDPQRCAGIIAKWEALTGLEAKRA